MGRRRLIQFFCRHSGFRPRRPYFFAKTFLLRLSTTFPLLLKAKKRRGGAVRRITKNEFHKGLLIILIFSPFQRYRLALEMDPLRQTELLLNLGSMHHALGEWEAAERHYIQCLKLEPNNQVVIANMKLLELKYH